MRLTTKLLFLAAAPLPGVLLALADLGLGLRGDAVAVFVPVCVVMALALGAAALSGSVVTLFQHVRVGRWSGTVFGR